MIDRIVSTLEEVFAYMDDSRVGSPDKQTHLIHLQALFAALAANVSPLTWKSVFQCWKFWLAGSAHAAVINSCPPSQDIKPLQCFLGIVKFYRHFLPGCACILRALTDLLRGKPETLE
jgi:hypothetical protein